MQLLGEEKEELPEKGDSSSREPHPGNARKAGIALHMVQSTKKVLQPLAEQAAEKVLQPLAELPAQATKKVKVLQPLAELLPAQAAAELVQPGAPPQAANSIQPLAELQHVLMRRRWTRIRTRRPLQKTSVQPLAELQHEWT